MIRRLIRTGLLSAMLLAGIPACSSSPTSPAPPPTTTEIAPTPRLPVEQQLRDAFRQPDPDLRREQVLAAVGSYLRDDAIRQTDDVIATTYFNEIVFSSGRLTLPDPALIQRQGELAVAVLPEGMGVYLFDLSTDSEALTLNQWAIGLGEQHIIWREDEIGLSYVTTGKDGVCRLHFMLAVRDESGWKLGWDSDEAPDWWFNAAGGDLTVADDLSNLQVVGEAPNTTDDFYEQSGEPRREFAITWIRQGNRYVMAPLLADFDDRSAWFRAAAVPSPYATLVAFIEYLESNRQEEAAKLVANPEVLQAVNDFGLSDSTRRYQVAAYTENRIVFRDTQGTFVATFAAPDAAGDPWLIDHLSPLGAAGEGDSSAADENATP